MITIFIINVILNQYQYYYNKIYTILSIIYETNENHLLNKYCVCNSKYNVIMRYLVKTINVQEMRMQRGKKKKNQ